MMARGELVPDDVVVAIVADRIEQPDAKNGFILDGFPRTVPQAEALDRMLEDKGMRLDAAIELKVDEGILHQRIAKRVADMQARGETIRADDNPEALEKRVHAYRVQTAPLVSYYRDHGLLRTTDGMAPIEEVSVAIDRILGRAEKAAAEVPRRKAAVRKPARQARVARKAKPARVSKAKAAARKRPAKSRAKSPIKAAARRASAKRSPARRAGRKAINKAGRRG
jgi:adenylate kinase